MKILFDYISIQGTVNGGAEYTKVILAELVKQKKNRNISIFALFDSQIPILDYNSFLYDNNFDGYYDITKIESIAKLVEKERIDSFFIGILQRVIKHDLSNIRCHVVAVLHDIASYEIKKSNLHLLNPNIISVSIKEAIKHKLSCIFSKFKSIEYYFEKNSTYIASQNFDVVTVSNFSKSSIQYNLPFLRNKKIYVLYSPLRKAVMPKPVPSIARLTNIQKKYFLMLSSNRWLKNTQMAMDVLEEFCKIHSDYYVVTTGNIVQQFNCHVSLPYVSDEELAYLLKNATALIYPTLFEGFGYPPLEAMRFGTPVLCSGFTSLPEVVGEAGIIFSPFFRSDLYAKLNSFIIEDRKKLEQQSLHQFELVSARQNKDLHTLIDLILQNS